jgi:hypothetical protein
MVSCSIIMGHILKDLKQTRKAQQRGDAVCCGAGLSVSQMLVLPAGPTAWRSLGTTTTVSVWRGLRNY